MKSEKRLELRALVSSSQHVRTVSGENGQNWTTTSLVGEGKEKKIAEANLEKNASSSHPFA